MHGASGTLPQAHDAEMIRQEWFPHSVRVEKAE
jgi:hypothetical protein